LQVIALIAARFVNLVMISFVIAAPLAKLAMNKWLQNFAYRTSIGWWILAIAGIMALLIAFVTVSFQAIKAALANPVESLRTE
jgi:putative ABC transport system permease protein